MPFAFAGTGRRETMFDEKQGGGGNDKQNNRVARQSISEPFPARRLQILLHGQRPDIAFAAPIEITRAGVMHGMFPPPEVVGRDRDYAGDEAPCIIGFTGLEKRTMTTVVKNDENT